MSSTVSYLASNVPEALSAPVVTLSGSFIKIAWSASADDHGSAVTAYQILIREDDGDDSEDTVNCNGADGTTISNLFCLVPLTSLTASPYSLAVTDEVLATVLA